VIEIKFEEHIQKMACQPNHDFPKTQFEKILHRSNRAWFIEYANWLDYSILEDVACRRRLVCYSKV
jgi:hypothetical protein